MRSNSVSNVYHTLTLPNEQHTEPVTQTKEDFNNVLNNQTMIEKDGDFCEMELCAAESSANEVQQTYEKERSEVACKEITKAEDDSKMDETVIEEKREKLESEIVKLISEETNVSEEEIRELMEALGITLDSLLNGSGLKDLMMQLTGAEDMTELLLSETFGNLMKELDVLVQEFSNQLDMTPEELKEVLALQTEVVTEELIDMETSASEEDSDLVEMLNSSKQMKIESVQVTEETLLQNDTQTGTHEKEAMLNQNDSGASQQVTYRDIQTTVNTVSEQLTQVVEQNFIDADDIMKQITEFTKVTVQQTQSSIEIQLNPAHLGKVYLQVMAKDGVITAQLAAENEAVKQVLENQISVLKENMNQQGLKVEAVEVTIASHEFERNLEDNQQSAQEKAQQEGKKSQRFLTADVLDELSGIMTEEEKIVAQIMLDNGNSMDVTA